MRGKRLIFLAHNLNLILTDLWAIEDIYTAKLGSNVDAVCDHLITVEEASGQIYVPYQPRRIATEPPGSKE